MFQLPFLLFTLDNPEWLIILLIVVILFGGSRLGGVGAALGQSIREFKRAARDDDDQQPRPAETPPAVTSLPQSSTSPAAPAMQSAPTRSPAPIDYLPASGAVAAEGPLRVVPGAVEPQTHVDGAAGDRTSA